MFQLQQSKWLLLSLLVFVLVSTRDMHVEALDLKAPMRKACDATRRTTDMMEGIAYKIKNNVGLKIRVDPTFEHFFTDVSASLGVFTTDASSPAAWNIIGDFLDRAIRNEIFAHSALAVSVVYLVDELCLKHEIEDSIQEFGELKERFYELHNKWLYEKLLIKDFQERLKGNVLKNEVGDVIRLDKIKTLVAEVKGLLTDIHTEIHSVHETHEKSKSHAIMSVGLGTLGAAMTYFTGNTKYLSHVWETVMVTGATGTVYSVGNMVQSGMLLKDLETLKLKAEDLYEDIDRVHMQLQISLT
ncbi:uncharacterized protein LOC144432851 [Glandiceps talaboti]